MGASQTSENKIYLTLNSQWKNKVIMTLFFFLVGSLGAIVCISIIKYEAIFIPSIITNSTTPVSQAISDISNATFTFNGLILGFTSVFIFNFISWSDRKMSQAEINEKVREDISTVRKGFAKFAYEYIEISVTCLVAQLLFFLIKSVSDFGAGVILFGDFLCTIIILQGFRIILWFVLYRIELERF